MLACQPPAPPCPCRTTLFPAFAPRTTWGGPGIKATGSLSAALLLPLCLVVLSSACAQQGSSTLAFFGCFQVKVQRGNPREDVRAFLSCTKGTGLQCWWFGFVLFCSVLH